MRALLFATLDANADNRRQAELQLKQVWSLFVAGLGRIRMGAPTRGRDAWLPLAPRGRRHTHSLRCCCVTLGSHAVWFYAMLSSRPAIRDMILEGTSRTC